MTPMNSLRMLRAWIVLGSVLGLAACGGGSTNKAGVTNLQASGVGFARTLTVTVNGSGLTNDNLKMIVEGPCGTVTPVAGATDIQMQFSCDINGVGDLIPRIRTGEDVELASLRLKVPNPQVSMRVKQGAATGTIVLELDAVAAPVSTTNFLAYVNSAFYTNTIFHRVEAGVVIQGGGYTASATGPTSKAPTSPAIALESNNGLKNLRGTIGMARNPAVLNSATSQFYINLVDNPDFDHLSDSQPGYAVFGKVVSGLDVVDLIAAVPLLGTNKDFKFLPATDVVLSLAVQSK